MRVRRIAGLTAAALLVALLCTSGCVRVPRAGAVAAEGEAVETRPGLRLPGWLPRGELFWDRGGRYRLFSEPTVTLENRVPQFGLGEKPLVEGKIGFKLNVDAAGFVEQGEVESIPDRVEVRRAFLTTSGVFNLPRPIYYNAEFGLLDKEFYLDSAWIMFRDIPWIGSLKLGGIDAPISLDNMMSSRDRTFMEVAAPVQAFVPATSVGMLAERTFADTRGSWGLGMFSVGQRRDVGDQSEALARIVGRTTWLLRAEEPDPKGRWPELVHLGLAGSYTFAAPNQVRYDARPESFLAPVAVDTDDIDARHAFVLGFEAAARRGPLSFQGEFFEAFVDRSSARFPGLYLSLAGLLTGEVRPYDREQAAFGQVVPRRPLDPRARAWGAAEWAARYSYVDLDDADFKGGRMHVLTAGLNWYWNSVVRWQFNYERAFIDGGPLDGRLHVFQARFQLVL